MSLENDAEPTDSQDKDMETAEPKGNEEDDLEEGELKDDDDDDEDEEIKTADEDVASQHKSSSSSEASPVRPPSSSSPSSPSSSSSSSSSSSTSSSSSSSSSSTSSSSSMSNSREHSSSKGSSRIGSHLSSTGKNNGIIGSYDKYSQRSRLSSMRNISEDRYRIGKDHKEDPSEKAAMLISMRTKLLEMRSREIEAKFQKNKAKISTPPLTLINTGLQRNVKMTIAKPSISYSENPNPSTVNPAPVSDKKKKSKSKTKERSKEKSKEKTKEKEKKSKKSKKKKKKRKKKASSKKHKKHKSASASKKPAIEPKVDSPKDPEPLPAVDTNDHQGPRTPPDNHVMNLEDEQIEWPSHLIKMTLTQPSISYSVNPASILEPGSEEHRKDTLKESGQHNKRRRSTDHKWYYNYFMNSFEMTHTQAEYQANYTLISASSSMNEDVENDAVPKRLVEPKVTVVIAEKEVVLPNGQVLPPGTVQKIVHPYPKLGSNVLGPCFDLY